MSYTATDSAKVAAAVVAQADATTRARAGDPSVVTGETNALNDLYAAMKTAGWNPLALLVAAATERDAVFERFRTS